jgi:hypothetical protein
MKSTLQLLVAKKVQHCVCHPTYSKIMQIKPSLLIFKIKKQPKNTTYAQKI